MMPVSSQADSNEQPWLSYSHTGPTFRTGPIDFSKWPTFQIGASLLKLANYNVIFVTYLTRIGRSKNVTPVMLDVRKIGKNL